VPWCETCSKFWNPNSVGVEGTCPACGRKLPPPAASTSVAVEHEPAAGAAGVADAGEDEPDEFHAPWHFKLMLVALGIYLAWRAFQGVEWLVHQL
jgi:hypothetical protein